ncbi:MAG TPA: hypothetical protein VFL45_08335 [Gammaproteobacteria bacterium]|nr:hypothetical protein [Gammaproteobacteria bacterium]
MNKLILLPLLAALAGCSTAPRMPDVVQVPVSVGCEKVQVQSVPHLPIQDLTESSTPAEVQKALVQSIGILMGDDATLRAKLAPYTRSGDNEPTGEIPSR